MMPAPFVRAAEPPAEFGSGNTQSLDWPVMVRYTVIPLTADQFGAYHEVMNAPGWFAYFGPGTRHGLQPVLAKANQFYLSAGLRMKEEFLPLLPRLYGQAAWPNPRVYPFTWEQTRPPAYRLAMKGTSAMPVYAYT